MDLLVIGGGLSIPRELDSSDPFESALDEEFGCRCSIDTYFFERLWSSLSNIVWRHADFGPRLYSFRAAGDLVAALHADSCYLDWYCCAPAGLVDEVIAARLFVYGWTWQPAKVVDDHSAWLT